MRDAPDGTPRPSLASGRPGAPRLEADSAAASWSGDPGTAAAATAAAATTAPGKWRRPGRDPAGSTRTDTLLGRRGAVPSSSARRPDPAARFWGAGLDPRTCRRAPCVLGTAARGCPVQAHPRSAVVDWEPGDGSAPRRAWWAQRPEPPHHPPGLPKPLPEAPSRSEQPELGGRLRLMTPRILSLESCSVCAPLRDAGGGNFESFPVRPMGSSSSTRGWPGS